MKRIEILFFLSMFSLVLVFCSCGDDTTTAPPVTNNNDSCGSAGEKHETYQSLNYTIPSTYTLGSERYYNFFFGVDSICTDKHVTSSFYAVGYDTAGIPIRFSSAIEWQLLWERTDTGSTEHFATGIFEWNSTISDLGLKVPFGENAASVFANVYVHFPTLGSAALDSAFLRRKVRTVSIKFNYNYHKPRTSLPESMIELKSMPVIAINRKDDLFYDPALFDNRFPVTPRGRQIF